MKRVLVTGASGFIGRHTLAALLDRDYEVHGVTNRGLHDRDARVRWHHADVLSAAAVEELVGSVRPSHLLHLAWYVEPGKFWSAPENVSWLEASIGLLRAFQRHGGNRAVIAGSCAEYDWRYGFCSEYVTPLAPQTLYGSCKHALQIALEAYASVAGLSIAWGRIFFLYGPWEPPAKLVAFVVRALLAGRPAPTSEGTQVRDFMHVHDVADAFAATLDSSLEGPVNIASGVPVAVRDVLMTIGSLTGRPELIELGARPAVAGEPPLLVGDATRLRRELGWEPQHTLETGLANTIAWWRAQDSQHLKGN